LEEIETQQLTARLAAMRSVLCGQERAGQTHKCFYPAQEAHSSKPQDVKGKLGKNSCIFSDLK